MGRTGPKTDGKQHDRVRSRHHNITNTVMFSPKEIRFIEQMIDDRIAFRKRTLCKGSYHTKSDVRAEIVRRLDDFKKWAGSDTFHISVLRHFLRNALNLTEMDLHITQRSRGQERRRGGTMRTYCMFDDVLQQSMRSWPGSPFCDGYPNGYYRFKDCQHRVQLELTPDA